MPSSASSRRSKTNHQTAGGEGRHPLPFCLMQSYLRRTTIDYSNQ
nr:MAG TPA: hypothetical protein [Caudoviricetes sp.]